MKYVGLIIGILALGFLGRFASDTLIPRGHIYQYIDTDWTLQAENQLVENVKLPAVFDRLTKAKPGATGNLHRTITIPDNCKTVPCYLFFGEVGDLARVSLNNVVIRSQGYADGAKTLSKHFPLWAELPHDTGGSVKVSLDVESLYGIGFGVSSGPAFIGDYAAVRFFERKLSLQSVTFPLMQSLLLTILGVLVLLCWRLSKLDRSVFHFGIFCLVEAAFSASFSLLPREYLSVTNASATHFGLRLLGDWALFECINALLPMFKSARYAFRAAFAGYLGWIAALYFQGESYPAFVNATQWAFPVIVGTPIAGLVTAMKYWKLRQKISDAKSYELPILIITFAVLSLCQIWDTSLFWGFVRGTYLVKFYLAPLALVFAIVYVLRYFRHYEALLKAKAESDTDALLGRIAVEFSHDLKSPLNALRDCAHTALATQNVDFMKEVLEQVVQRTTNVSSRLQELFKYAREDIAEKAKVHLIGMCEEIKAEIAPAASTKSIKINFKFPDQEFLLDGQSFKRALQNLIHNAIEAVPENGSIDVSGEIVSRRLVLSVKDNGAGISDENISKIFDPYFTDGKQAGTGLGLAIVDRIVRQHGGSIQVFSKVGKGSNFVMEIPQ